VRAADARARRGRYGAKLAKNRGVIASASAALHDKVIAAIGKHAK